MFKCEKFSVEKIFFCKLEMKLCKNIIIKIN
jgi:hypothetical protein